MPISKKQRDVMKFAYTLKIPVLIVMYFSSIFCLAVSINSFVSLTIISSDYSTVDARVANYLFSGRGGILGVSEYKITFSYNGKSEVKHVNLFDFLTNRINENIKIRISNKNPNLIQAEADELKTWIIFVISILFLGASIIITLKYHKAKKVLKTKIPLMDTFD